MEGPVIIPVAPPVPLMAKVRFYLHARKCEECRVRFWAGMAVEYSTKAILAMQANDLKPTLYARGCLLIANFASRRRTQYMRALGLVPFEDLTDEQKQAAIAEMNAAHKKAFEEHQRSLH